MPSIVEPLAYMNDSGPPTLGVATFYKVPPPRILVIVDDLDLPFGALAFAQRRQLRRPQRAQVADRGVRSGLSAFARRHRPRSRERARRSAHVLGRFSSDEEAALPALIDRCIDGIETLADERLRARDGQDQLDKSKEDRKEEPKDD